MKGYFEDSIAFIKPQDVRGTVNSVDIWGEYPTVIRQTWQNVVCGEDFPDIWFPGSLTGYNMGSCYFEIMDDFGNLVMGPCDADGVLPVVYPPMSMTHCDRLEEAVFLHNDYGDCLILDYEYIEDGVYLYTLSEDGSLKDYTDEAFIGYEIPGKFDYRILPHTINEHGWEILHSHATLDGMLCVRWLDLYGRAPDEEYSSITLGFNSEVRSYWNTTDHSRKTSRKVFQFETGNQRELAAEVFPMETGSLLARYKLYQEDHATLIGLVIDPMLSDLRRIYPQDCYSIWNEDSQQLEADRTYLKFWEGWTHARTAWEHYPIQKRLRRTYTEGFIRNSTPCAVVVYGDVTNLNRSQKHYVQKFKKNGYPIYWLEVPNNMEN
jgi:hypothetical protein